MKGRRQDIRQDIVVGTVQSIIREPGEGEQPAGISMTIETFGTEGSRPAINAHTKGNRGENPGHNPAGAGWTAIQEGAVLRFRGWLDRAACEMELASASLARDAEFTVLVCGGRDFQDYRSVEDELDLLQPDRIIHGAARGADSLAGRYARDNRVECREFPAVWRPADGRDPETGRPLRKGYNPRAGFQRNDQMLRDGRPDLVVAFPGGRGTAHMAWRTRMVGCDLQEVPPRG